MYKRQLLSKGREALLAARHHLRTPAYEDVVEATVLLSGLGFECTGVSIAHGLEAGFHVLPIRPLLHGTGVGLSLIHISKPSPDPSHKKPREREAFLAVF